MFFAEIRGGGGSEQVRDTLLDLQEPPTDDVERFLSLLRFDARDKLNDLLLE